MRIRLLPLFLLLAVAALVPGATSANTLAGGEQHTVVVKTDGTVWAWGLNANGQLGAGVARAVPHCTD